ncbi:MAG: CheR family methyltransferase [Gammaproteobacteria bacterium]
MQDRAEFEFTDKHFKWFVKLVFEKTGITLAEQKRDLVYGRLARRLRKLKLSSFDEYCKLLSNNPEDEMVDFVNSITTNLTSFYREAHHFEYLNKTALTYLREKRKSEKRIRIWSAGCSTGEEPYSIAMTVRESFPDINDWDIKILATDIDTNVLAKASAGVYQKDKMTGISKERLKKWFMKPASKNSQDVKVNPKIRELITFKQLNLMETWPMKGQFDVLFCRNVVIYFNKDTQRVLFDRFANVLKEDSYMFLGHSESLYKVSDRFNLLGKTIHQKAA